jgi:hypothetical protein
VEILAAFRAGFETIHDGATCRATSVKPASTQKVAARIRAGKLSPTTATGETA